jgi:hypothetical protein
MPKFGSHGVGLLDTELRIFKTYTRKLDDATRTEFLQWLVDQGAVLSLVPNPSFTGFTDGRRTVA